MNLKLSDIQDAIADQVSYALKEDIGSGDITAELIPENQNAKAQVITREQGILCGQAWVEEVYKQLDKNVAIKWLVKDGESVKENQLLFELEGSARSLLTGERCALNFLQTLSATATVANQYQQLIGDNNLKILDTRKTIPGLRLAQKFAVNCGGCHNHRIGLYDAFLIKENHIAACGSITKAIETARKNHAGKTVEVEVENLEEFHEAQNAGADIIMLDNFSLEQIEKAVAERKADCKIEVSGGISEESIPDIAKTGADFISIGALTKHVRAMDLSFRLI
jgi:nicotinate-nucleotide pyrophosphorylase (carboxylating)